MSISSGPGWLTVAELPPTHRSSIEPRTEAGVRITGGFRVESRPGTAPGARPPAPAGPVDGHWLGRGREVDHRRGGPAERAAEGQSGGLVDRDVLAVDGLATVDVVPSRPVRAGGQADVEAGLAVVGLEHEVLRARIGQGISRRREVSPRLHLAESDELGEPASLAHRMASRLQ